MKDLVVLTDCWKQHRSIKAVLGLNLQLTDIQGLRSNIHDMEAQARREVFRALREIAKSLSDKIEMLSANKRNLGQEISHVGRHNVACLAYHKQHRFQKIDTKQREMK